MGLISLLKGCHVSLTMICMHSCIGTAGFHCLKQTIIRAISLHFKLQKWWAA